MTQENKDRAKRVSELDSAPDVETIATRKPEQVFLKGADRKRRRRLDLRTLHGTAREHAKVYRALAEGTISQADAEIRSRVLGRHKDILAALDQSKQIRDIQEQLAALRGESSALLPRMDDKPDDDLDAVPLAPLLADTATR